VPDIALREGMGATEVVYVCVTILLCFFIASGIGAIAGHITKRVLVSNPDFMRKSSKVLLFAFISIQVAVHILTIGSCTTAIGSCFIGSPTGFLFDTVSMNAVSPTFMGLWVGWFITANYRNKPSKVSRRQRQTKDHIKDASLVSHQPGGSGAPDFLYDAFGQVYGLMYNGAPYLYQRNDRGDILGIMDSANDQVVAYNYDTGGKLISITGPLALALGMENPIR